MCHEVSYETGCAGGAFSAPYSGRRTAGTLERTIEFGVEKRQCYITLSYSDVHLQTYARRRGRRAAISHAQRGVG